MDDTPLRRITTLSSHLGLPSGTTSPSSIGTLTMPAFHQENENDYSFDLNEMLIPELTASVFGDKEISIDDLKAQVGKEIGVSPWFGKDYRDRFRFFI